MKNKNEILRLLLLLICLYSCTMSRDINAPFETTVTVVDMQGKPLSGRTVQTTGGSYNSSSNALATGITDANGRAILKYTLLYPSSSGPESVSIIVKDDALLKGINSCYHTTNGSKNTTQLICTIKMDSIVPFKVRLIRTDTTVVNFIFTGGWLETGNATYNLSHQFVNWLPKNIGSIDSTFTLLTWQNTPFGFWTSADKNGISVGKILRHEANPLHFRDTMMLIRH